MKISGWAFSISSNNTTEYGLRLTASVNWPPSSWPTYPGGEPIKRETLNFSWYSDMSILIIASISPNIYSARAFTVSVLPTPVGPKNIKDPLGFLWLATPVLDLLITLHNASTALSWPMIIFFISLDIALIILRSSVPNLLTGIPVCVEIVSAISETLICLFDFLSDSSHSLVTFNILPSIEIWSSLSLAATS